MIRTQGWWLATAVLMTLSCGQLIKPPVVTLEKLDVLQMTLAGPVMQATLRVQNPNVFPVRASKVVYSVTVEGAVSDEGTITTPLSVPAGGEEPLILPVRIPWSAGFGALNAAMSKGVVEGQSTGVITVDAYVTSIDVPFTLNGRFNVGGPEPKNTP